MKEQARSHSKKHTRKKRERIVVWTMLIAMVLSSLMAGLSMFM